MIQSISRRWEFDLLRDAGHYRRSGPVGLRRITGDQGVEMTPVPRVAFAIGRRVGGAVVRNRVRRRLREILAAIDRRGELAPGRYLFIVAPAAATTGFDDLRSHVERVVGVTA